MAEISFAANPSLKDAVVVVIATPDGVQQMTIHRPIGVTALSADDWVVTETSDVPNLLARAEHPEQKRVEEARSIERRFLAAVAAQGLTVRGTGDQRVVEGPGGLDFFAALASARRQAKAQAPAGTEVPADAYKRLLPSDEVRAANEAYLTAIGSEAVRTQAEGAIPLPAYETRGGPLADRPQVARVNLKGKTRAQVKDALARVIFDI